VASEPGSPALLDPLAVPARTTTNYPEPLARVVAGRSKRALGEALGLRNFGVNLTRLEPGAASALRHWHTRQDEFVWVLEGELTLVTSGREQRLRAGQAAGFRAGHPDGHHLVNRSAAPALYLEIGDRLPGDEAQYPDDDLAARGRVVWEMTRRDGTRY
jgi:uncharacterized cupin superfamily protein